MTGVKGEEANADDLLCGALSGAKRRGRADQAHKEARRCPTRRGANVDEYGMQACAKTMQKHDAQWPRCAYTTLSSTIYWRFRSMKDGEITALTKCHPPLSTRSRSNRWPPKKNMLFRSSIQDRDAANSTRHEDEAMRRKTRLDLVLPRARRLGSRSACVGASLDLACISTGQTPYIVYLQLLDVHSCFPVTFFGLHLTPCALVKGLPSITTYI